MVVVEFNIYYETFTYYTKLSRKIHFLFFSESTNKTRNKLFSLYGISTGNLFCGTTLRRQKFSICNKRFKGKLNFAFQLQNLECPVLEISSYFLVQMSISGKPRANQRIKSRVYWNIAEIFVQVLLDFCVKRQKSIKKLFRIVNSIQVLAEKIEND